MVGVMRDGEEGLVVVVEEGSSWGGGRWRGGLEG